MTLKEFWTRLKSCFRCTLEADLDGDKKPDVKVEIGDLEEIR